MEANDEVSVEPPSLSSYRFARGGRGNAVADTTRALREAILDGVLAPNEWLREESVREVLGVSRTPVREALNRLEEEGLIHRTPGQGARVTTLTIEDMLVVYNVRGSLESLTARMAAENAPRPEKIALETLHRAMAVAADRGDPVEFSRINIGFHAALTAMADNAYLDRLLSTVETAIRRFGTRSFSAERMAHIVLEHEAIVSAVIDADGARAAQAALDHAEFARTSTLDRFLARTATLNQLLALPRTREKHP
ncbi:GntR family transcriptional regulator [Cryobacterium sp. Y82]|uniref:GntR family transcriptional regulator n=1 Tax=Cryobacterium sp. Y82 TaxID=2045017 RepID=UPI000CE43485|nr:GntR family transcriptional regulator [Cryobacterium sp. Y82]